MSIAIDQYVSLRPFEWYSLVEEIRGFAGVLTEGWVGEGPALPI